MVRRPLVLLLNAVFALALFTGPAAAVTFVSITPSNTNNAGAPYLLVADAIYTYNSPTMEIGTVNDTFTFQYTPPPNLAAASSVAINDLSPVFPMTLNWLFNTTNSLIGAVSAQPSAVSASPGADINTTLSLADGAGFYFLQLSGTVRFVVESTR